MLQAIRDRATGWIAYTILILLGISFALFGITSYFGNPAVPDVAFVDGEPINQQDFQRAYQQARARAPNANDDLLRQQVLQQLVDQQVLMQVADNLNLSLSDQQLNAIIRTNPDFQVNGFFDPALYERRLIQFGADPAIYEQNLRQAMSINQLQQGLMASAFTTDKAINQLSELQNQQRHVQLLTLPLAQMLAEQNPNDEELAAFHKQNAARFQSPERVKLQYLALNIEAMAEAVDISDELLQQEYEARKDRYTIPEERSARHILITLPSGATEAQETEAKSRAQELYERLQAGTSYDELIAELADADDIEADDLGTINRGMMESSFEDALYALEEVGAVTEPVKTSFGYHLIELTDIRPEQVTPLAEVKDELIQELRQRQVEPEFYAAADSLANLSFEQPDNLTGTADALGLPLLESDWLERNSREGIAQYSEVMEAAFSQEVLEDGYNSQVLEVEPGHLIVVRKLDYQPAQPMSFEEAREQIETQLKTQQAREVLTKQVKALLEQARTGKSLQELADQQPDAQYQEISDLERNDSRLDPVAREQAFRLSPPNDAQAGFEHITLSNGDQAILAVLAVDSAEVADSDEQEALQETLQQQLGLRQYQAFMASQRTQAEVETYPDRL